MLYTYEICRGEISEPVDHARTVLDVSGRTKLQRPGDLCLIEKSNLFEETRTNRKADR